MTAGTHPAVALTELLSWMVFGHRLGSSLIMRVADELHVENPRRV